MRVFTLFASTVLFTCFSLSAWSQDEEEPQGVIEPEMSQMSCLEVVDALNAESEVLGGAPERGLISNDQVVNLGTNVGQRLALDSGHGNLSVGLGIAGRALGRRERQREAEAAAVREEATRRWYYLSGIYDGRDCDSLIASELENQSTGE